MQAEDYRGAGDIVDDVAGSMIAHDLALPAHVGFPSIDVVFENSDGGGGDYLWAAEHIPEENGLGKFLLWIGNDMGEEFLEWEKIVETSEFVSAIYRQIDSYADLNLAKAEELRSILPEKIEALRS